MKSQFLNKIIRFVHAILLIYYRIKCRIFFYLYGTEGIGYVVEKLPRIFIIPILKSCGCTIGKNCSILPGLTLHNLGGKQPLLNLALGDNVYIGRDVLLDLAEHIELLDDSALGARCQVWTHVGDYSYDFSDYHEKKAPVKIGKGVLCWSMVLISPGISIGDYTRVAAGSVVIKNLESKMFYGGVPAKFIKKREI
jgi:acetyltransferase-like isoleucine patch superfamily enzyme